MTATIAMLRLHLLSVLLFAGCAAPAARYGAPQEAPPARWSAGPEVRVYPAGVIAGARVERSLEERDLLVLSAAYNATDRRDFGEHDDEDGGGPGIGAGWRRYLRAGRSGWFWGGRLDLWDLEIDWEDDRSGGGKRKGSTDVIVLQPSGEGGYSWDVGGGWRFDLSLSLGAEINVDTDGEDVGEGAIGLLGFAIVHGF